jgi:hypothetical protein
MRGGDHFLKSVLQGKLISLVGSLDDLEKATRRTQGPHSPNRQERTGPCASSSRVI